MKRDDETYESLDPIWKNNARLEKEISELKSEYRDLIIHNHKVDAIQINILKDEVAQLRVWVEALRKRFGDLDEKRSNK